MERGIVRLSATAGLLTVVLFSGCAYLKPYVPLDPLAPNTGLPCFNPPVPSTASTTSGPMPNVEQATRKLEAWVMYAEFKHDCSATTTRVLNVGTFGLAAAAGVAPVYNAYKDLITGLAIGAGGAYMANTLFFPADQASLYVAAEQSFSCVRGKGRRLLSAVSNQSLEEFESQFEALRAKLAACSALPTFSQMQVAYAEADDALGRAIKADADAANLLDDSGANIDIALTRELDSRAASAEAIYAAGKSIATFAPTQASTKPATPPPAPPSHVPGAAPAPCSPSDMTQIKTQTVAYADKKKQIDAALDALRQLDTACVLNPAALPDLTVSQDSITLTPGAFVNIVVNGGRAPYLPLWEGADPSGNGIDASFVPPSTIRVGATSKLTTATSYTLDIRDSSVAGQTKKIAVAAKLSP